MHSPLWRVSHRPLALCQAWHDTGSGQAPTLLATLSSRLAPAWQERLSGITDSAIRKWSSPSFQGREMRLSVGGGPGPPGVINGIRRPTRCSRRCQEMIAYKMYQLPSRLPAHHAARQINTSAASLHLPGLGEGPVSRAMGRAPRQRQEDHPSPTSPPQPMKQASGTGGGALAKGDV